MSLNFRVLGMAALALGAIALSSTTKAADPDRVVLPTSVAPTAYRITITPDTKALTFSGDVQIDISVRAATATIVLNSADLVIDHAGLTGAKAPLTVAYDSAAQTVTLAAGRVLKPGAYTLNLAYHGQIFRQASGLFALDYATPSGQARALYTQFENSDARRFVPSWDEPGRKATFQLTAIVPEGQMALSNMPVAAAKGLGGGLQRVEFAPTPKMSSYLLFFGLGDFERVHKLVDGIDVGVVVKRGDAARGQFALEAAEHILPYYNDYFGTPYPLPKLDLIAGPGSSQFFGAMENWGAIFYFDRALLIDSKISTEADRQGVYSVVAHEMAHQWFGDLVTMDWWDGLWLNEGFASWMENKATDHFHPEWNVWLQSLGAKQGAMQVDARIGTHPIITPIHDAQQASSAFDTITYEKGAAVIRMLEGYLGEDAFRAGVRRYMHAHAYGNTVTDDLWAAVDEGSAHPIADIAHDFTLQAGVPMITEAAACDAGQTTLTLGQSHFAIDATSTTAIRWRVPVTVATFAGGKVKTVVASPTPTTVTLPGCGPVVLNDGQSAYFRSRYTREGLAALSSRYGDLSADNQLGILYDTATLANAGAAPMADFLTLTAAFPASADPVVADALAGRLIALDRLYDDLPGQEPFRTYARSVLTPIHARLGWDPKPGEPDNTQSLRATVIEALGRFGDPEVLAEARKRFDRFLADPNSLDAGTRRSVLGVTARRADTATWNRLHALAVSAKSLLEQQQAYDLLGAAEDPALARKALDLALSGEPPATIAPEIIGTVAGRHPDLAFEFATTNWDKLAPLLEPNTRSQALPRLIAGSNDVAIIARLDAFAETHIPPGSRQTLRQVEAGVRYQAHIRTDRLPEVDAWLKTHGR